MRGGEKFRNKKSPQETISVLTDSPCKRFQLGFYRAKSLIGT